MCSNVIELNNKKNVQCVRIEHVQIIYDTRLNSEYEDCVHLISIDAFHNISINDDIETFITSDYLFDLIVSIAGRLLKIDKNNLVIFIGEPSKGSSWYVHPMLLKSILRYVESSIINESNIVREILGKGPFFVKKNHMINGSLLSIVKDIKCRALDKKDTKHKCNEIMNPYDIFNDDILMDECTKYLSWGTNFGEHSSPRLGSIDPRLLCNFTLKRVAQTEQINHTF
jgi:hypothetical protein